MKAILACAKGISSGYVPLGALLVHDSLAAELRTSGDPFFSGQTYSCIPLAAATGLAVLDVIETEGLVARSATTGAYLKTRMQEVLGALPMVGDVRGLGLFLGVEFVADRQTREPFAEGLKVSARVQAAAHRHGVIVMGCRGTVEHTRGDHLLLAPPLILSEPEADVLVEGLRLAITEVEEGLKRGH